MNRSDLAKKLSKETKLTAKQAESLILAFGKTVSGALKKKERIVYSNFGSFYTVHYPSKIIYHPTLGKKKKMLMQPTDAVKWMPADSIKDLVDHGIETDSITSFGSSKKILQKKHDAGIPDRKAQETVSEDEEISIPIKVMHTAPETEQEPEKPAEVISVKTEKEITEMIEEPISIAKSAPAVRIINLIFKRAIRDGATAILFDPNENNVSVSFKINGKIFDKTTLKKSIYRSLLERMRLFAKITTKKSSPLQNPFSLVVDGTSEDFEYLSIPTVYGDKVMVNITDKVKNLKKLTELDLFDLDFNKIKHGLGQKGLVLVTGDSEKERTTMLYALTDYLHDQKQSIISVENHPSLIIPSFNQIKIDNESGLNYDKALDFITRFNPDVVLIDDLSSPALIEKALMLSSERVVVAGLKSRDCFELLKLLDNLGIDEKIISSYLNMVIATRSIVRICRSCKNIVKLDRKILKNIRDELSSLPSETRSRLRKIGSHFYESPGCHYCNHSGFSGSLNLFEILELNEKMKELIASDAEAEKLQKETVRSGFINMTQDGITKALLGETDVVEVLVGRV